MGRRKIARDMDREGKPVMRQMSEMLQKQETKRVRRKNSSILDIVRGRETQKQTKT